MSPDKPTYKELETRLDRSEAIIASLAGGEIDAVLSGENISLLRTLEDVETMRRIRRELERLIEERTAELDQSREKYRRVVDNIHDALITDDVQGRVTYVNDRFLQMYGFSREKVGSLKLEDYVAPEWRSVLRNRHDRRMRGEDVPPLFEYEAVRPDGERFWVEELVTPDVENGKIIGTQSSIRDITERKKAEEDLRISEKRYRTIFNAAMYALVEHDFSALKADIDRLKAEGVKDFPAYLVKHPEFIAECVAATRVIEVNAEAVALFQAQSKEDLIESYGKIFIPESMWAFGGFICDVAAGKSSFYSENVYETLKGERVSVLIRVSIPAETEKFSHILVSMTDITELKKVETALRNSETSLAEAQRIAHLGSWEWNIVENKLFGSDEIYRIVGIKPRQFEFTYDTFLTFVHPDDREFVKEAVKESLEGKRTYDIEHRIIRAGGIERIVHERGETEFDGGGSPVRMFGMVQDITERKNAERIISQFKSTLDQILDAVFMFDPETLKYFYVNHSAIDMTGYSRKELLAITPLDIIPEFTEDSLKEMLAQLRDKDKASLLFETVHRTKSDSLVPVEIFLQYIVTTGERGRFVAIARDITGRKRAEKAIEESKLLRKELEHMSRVITLSGLTASIAHEINQPLAAIRSNAQAAVRFLSWDSPDIEEVRKALADIIKDNRRADDIIRGLRSLVKRKPFEQIVFDVNTMVHEIISLLYNEVLEYKISIKKELAADLPPVYGDRIAVSQVVLNLMLNGIQAMAGLEIDSRELVVRTRQTDSTTIEFSVIDSGNGIGEDQKEQIFKPFYTTKADGMGMGLAICRSIIEANDGLIWFTNEPDRGANFHFTLPVFRKS